MCAAFDVPVQRLMYRKIRCLLPVAKKFLAPSARNNKHFSMQMRLKRMQQKASYNRAARPQQLVRLQTYKGYEKVGIVKRPTAEPRSYVGPGMWEEMSAL